MSVFVSCVHTKMQLALLSGRILPYFHPEAKCQYIDYASQYRKTSNIRRALVGNTIVNHSDVVGASPVGAAPTNLHLHSRLNVKGFGNDSRKTPRESFKCWDLVRLILETWRYIEYWFAGWPQDTACANRRHFERGCNCKLRPPVVSRGKETPAFQS